jgi:hypothetical protein
MWNDETQWDGPPEEINGFRLFERPYDGESGRIVYQGEERDRMADPGGVAHEYWFIEQGSSGDWKLVQAIATFERGEGYKRHMERLASTFDSNQEAVEALFAHIDDIIGDTVRQVFSDGSIHFEPPFSKEAAEYRSQGGQAFDTAHDRCGSCVHYIPGGGCHFVQGEIDPGDYCERFYADFGLFAHDYGDEVEINVESRGPNWGPTDGAIEEFVAEVERRASGGSVQSAPPGDDGRDIWDLNVNQKIRRLRMPREGDEWPGTWAVFEGGMSNLPSWRNEDGRVIRVHEKRDGETYGFVDRKGDEEWRGLTHMDLHDELLDYMSDHPGGR